MIFVPRSGVAMANDAVEQYIRNMLPFGIGLAAFLVIQLATPLAGDSALWASVASLLV